jgi:hypothetical protein
MLAIDLWNPHAGLAFWSVLVTAFLLGMVHGVTPDEHTWPITFSYAVGGYSSRAGTRNAIVFSLAFTAQRAIASELAYLALSRLIVLGSRANYAIYVVVGLAMGWAASYIRGHRLPWHLDLHLHPGGHLASWRRKRPTGSVSVGSITDALRPASAIGRNAADLEHASGASGERQPLAADPHTGLHLHVHGGGPLGEGGWEADPCRDCRGPDLHDPRPWMPALHGFIAGWGVGAFATILYTVLAPSMPSGAIGWLPGALFGIGTTAVQMLVGAAVGFTVRRHGGNAETARRVGLLVAARTLGVGGAAFVVAGLFGLAFPRLANASVSTGIHVHNLDQLGLPIVLVVVSVGAVGFGSLVAELRRVARRPLPTHHGTEPGAVH